MSRSKIASELEDIDVSSSKGLQEYCMKVRDMCRDLYLEIHYASDQVYELLAALPRSTARHDAKMVRIPLVKLADQMRLNGGLAMRTWATFQAKYETEMAHVKKRTPAKKFKFQ